MKKEKLQSFIDNWHKEELGLFEKLLTCKEDERTKVIAEIEALRYVRARLRKILKENN